MTRVVSIGERWHGKLHPSYGGDGKVSTVVSTHWDSQLPFPDMEAIVGAHGPSSAQDNLDPSCNGFRSPVL